MSIFRQFKYKGKTVDVGVLAQNVETDADHRFVTDAKTQSWDKKVDANGDTSNGKVTFTEAGSRAAINSGETQAIMFGKIKKWYTDFKAIVWSGSYNDLLNRPTLGGAASQGMANNLTTTASGYALDARQGPVIQQKVDEISSNLSSLNDAGAIKGMDAREDGVYITYTPKAGADPVSKKLGSILSAGTLLLQYATGDMENSTQTRNYTVAEKALYLVCTHGGGKEGSSLNVNITQKGNCLKIFGYTNSVWYTQLINTNIQMWELDIGSVINIVLFSNDMAFKLIHIFKIS